MLYIKGNIYRARTRATLGLVLLLLSLSGHLSILISKILGVSLPWLTIQTSTSIGIALAGVAIVLTAFGKWLAGRLLAAAVFFFGAATIAEYLFHINLGVDQFFQASAPLDALQYPGRLPPVVALSFVLSGIAFIFRFRADAEGSEVSAAAILGSLSGVLGATEIFGYFLANFGSLDSASYSHVSVPAAIAISLFGLHTAVSSFRWIRESEHESFRFYPSILTVLLISGFIALWQIQQQREVRYQADRVKVEAEKVKLEVENTLNDTARAIERFALRVEFLGTGNKKFLELDSHSYLNQIQILKRIGITDKHYNVFWSYPLELHSQVTNFNQSLDTVRREALEDARGKRHASLSRAVNLKSGGVGFIMPVAMFRDGVFIGVVYATIEAQKLFHSFVNSTHFQIQISEGQRTLVSSNHQNPELAELSQTVVVPWGTTSWMVKVIPTRTFISNSRSGMPAYILFFGTITCFLFGAFLQVLFKSRREALTNARNTEELNSKLRSALGERESALQWRKTILDSSDYSIISTDEDGIIQTINAAACKMLGYQASEVIGIKTPGIFHLPEEVVGKAELLSRELGRRIDPGFETFVSKARYLKKPDENEWTYVRKDQTQFPVNLTVTVLYALDGRVSGYLGIATDLTEKKRAQEELSVISKRLRRVIDASGEGIWEREYLPGSEKIHFIDAQAKTIFGISEAEIPEYRAILAQISDDDKAFVGAAIDEHVKNKTPKFEVEFKMNFPHSKTLFKWIHARGQVIFSNGKAPVLVSTVKDVTKEVHQRQQLRIALSAAETATKAKAEFLASMSHEIRTPLNGVIGMTDLLMETPLEKEQNNYARIIQQSGLSLLGLINDILDFSKIEAGKMELEQLPFSLCELVEGQADILIAKSKEKNLCLATFVEPALSQSYLGDPGRIGQILLNLTGNAIKFTASGGVLVRALPGKSGSPNDPKQVRFEVRDTGIGLSKDAMARLFQAFVQADESTARKYGGTGLGLSISKRLVEMMSGKIGVESSLGQGSTFWFELPLASVPQKNVVEFPTLKESARVLVLDEDVLVRDCLEAYLKGWGILDVSLDSLENGVKAVDRLETTSKAYDIIFIGSYSKPGARAGVANFIKRMSQIGAPKLVLINDFASSISEAEARILGFDSLISKPIKQSALAEVIREVSNKKVRTSISKGLIETAPRALAVKRNFRVLVADDVPVNQMVALKMLEILGCSAHAVANGIEVLEALERAPYDLILMDCQMPEMDGFEATKAIRNSPNEIKNSIPIIALTANAMAGDDKTCLEAGMSDYLSKPMKKDALRAMLEKWLAGKKSSAAA